MDCRSQVLQRRDDTELLLELAKKPFASLSGRNTQCQSASAIPVRPPPLIQQNVLHVLDGADGGTVAMNTSHSITGLGTLHDDIPLCTHLCFRGGIHGCSKAPCQLLECVCTHRLLELLVDVLREVPQTPAGQHSASQLVSMRQCSLLILIYHTHLYLPQPGNNVLRASSAAGSASVKIDSGSRSWHRRLTAARAHRNCSADSSLRTPCTSSRVLPHQRQISEV